MQIRILLPSAVLLAIFAVSAVAYDDHRERVDHYEGLPAETLEDAVKNFSEYNRKLAAVLDKGELTAEDLDTIHQLTYTLENALEKINEEFSALADTLEEVHVASETTDYETVKTKGQKYLSVSRQLIE